MPLLLSRFTDHNFGLCIKSQMSPCSSEAIGLDLIRGLSSTTTPCPSIHPFVEQRSDSHGLALCEEFVRQQIRFSGICNVNDTLGSCVERESMVCVCLCVCDRLAL